MPRRFFLFILPVALAAATALPKSVSIPVGIWVSHAFIGGPKCQPSGPVNFYTAPGFEEEKAKLVKTGVVVMREYFRDNATCQACNSCPNYHREIFFEVREKDLIQSEKTGYRKPSAPPSGEDLKEYEDNKKFKGKPDVPPETD